MPAEDEAPYFTMHINHNGYFYVVNMETREGQSAEAMAALKAVTDAASELVKVVTGAEVIYGGLTKEPSDGER